MNKQELKKILKPLIKECIKEVIFDDGILSGIISEVVRGVGTTQINEIHRPPVEVPSYRQENQQKQQILNEQKKKMLNAIGQEAYNGVNLFEGTTPTSAQGTGQHGPLSGQGHDPGVDISNFTGAAGAWKRLVGG